MAIRHWALVAMLGIVSLAYAIGGAVRYNIKHVEDYPLGPAPPVSMAASIVPHRHGFSQIRRTPPLT